MAEYAEITSSAEKLSCAMLKACRAEVESSELAMSKVGSKMRKEATIRCAKLHVKYRHNDIVGRGFTHAEVKEIV